MASMNEWRDAMAPDLAVFQGIASAAWERLPGQFRQMCGDLVIQSKEGHGTEVTVTLPLEPAPAERAA